MTDLIAIPVDALRELEIENIVDDEGGHLLCCRLPDDYVGLADAWCGKTVLVAYPEEATDEDLDDSCGDCIVANGSKQVRCPAGHDCKPAT